MFIDKSYFIGERDIPNTISAEVTSHVNDLIGIRESECLIKAMGYDLFTAFIQAIKDETDEQRMIDILIGKDFVGTDGMKKRWNGLVSLKVATTSLAVVIEGTTYHVNVTGHKIATTLISPIADYVYYHWLKHNNTIATSMGEQKGETQNATGAYPRYRLSRVNNEMVKRFCLLKEFLQVNYSVYPEFVQYAGSRDLWLFLKRSNPWSI